MWGIEGMEGWNRRKRKRKKRGRKWWKRKGFLPGGVDPTGPGQAPAVAQPFCTPSLAICNLGRSFILGGGNRLSSKGGCKGHSRRRWQ